MRSDAAIPEREVAPAFSSEENHGDRMHWLFIQAGA